MLIFALPSALGIPFDGPVRGSSVGHLCHDILSS